MLHADRILWLNHGRLLGDDTDGHIDTIVRMVSNNTLLYVVCEDKTDEQYEDFKAMEEELKQLRTRKGAPYRLIPLPFPDAIIADGERMQILSFSMVPFSAPPTHKRLTMQKQWHNFKRLFPTEKLSVSMPVRSSVNMVHYTV